MKKQNVLVTGGLGYIGSHICCSLLENNYIVYVIDNMSNSYISCIDNINEITKNNLKFFEGDIRDISFLDTVFGNNNIDVVIHCAGLKSPSESIIKPQEYYSNNIDGSKNLLQSMDSYGVDKIVFSSTAAVYGESKIQPVNENFPLSPSNPYGETKMIIEKMIINQSDRRKNFRYINLRYFNPIGAHRSGLLGENPKGNPDNLMPHIIKVASGKLDHISVFGDDYKTFDGTGLRDYIHVEDLSNAHIKAIDYLNINDKSGTYNIGTGLPVSVLELVKTFEAINKINIPFEICQRRSNDVDINYADPSKANESLHWYAEKNLNDMCEDSWRWAKKFVK